MSRVFRSDFIAVNDPRLDSYGNLRVNAVIARIGVQDYPQQDGTLIREFRPPDEVQTSVASLSDIPITIDHPEKPVNPTNYKDLSKGHTSPCRYEDGLVKTRLNVMDQEGVKVALSTHRQLSVGYTCRLDWIPGIWIDELGLAGEKGKSHEYDCIQRDIKGNHVALVPFARAGDIASIQDSILGNPSKELIIMAKIVHDSRVFEIEGTDAEAIAKLFEDSKTEKTAFMKKLSEAEKSEEEKKKEAEDASKKCDNLQATIDGLTQKLEKAEVKLDADVIATEVKARMEIISEVKDSLTTIDYSLDATGLKKAYLLTVASDSVKVKLDTASVDYIAALYDVLKPLDQQDSTKPLEKVLEKNDSVITTNVDSSKAITARRQAYLKKDNK